MTNSSSSTIATLSIRAEVNAEKNYLGLVIGLSARFGQDIQFLNHDCKIGKKTAYYTITQPGIYKHTPRTLTIAGSRRDTGFILISRTGEVTEITAQDVDGAYRSSRVTLPLPNSFGARSAWAQNFNQGVGFCGAPGCGRVGCADCQD